MACLVYLPICIQLSDSLHHFDCSDQWRNHLSLSIKQLNLHLFIALTHCLCSSYLSPSHTLFSVIPLLGSYHCYCCYSSLVIVVINLFIFVFFIAYSSHCICYVLSLLFMISCTFLRYAHPHTLPKCLFTCFPFCCCIILVTASLWWDDGNHHA